MPRWLTVPVTLVLFTAVMLAVGWTPARAQISNSAVDAAIEKHKAIRLQWEQCFMAAFLSESNQTKNKALAAERGFASCTTEENLFINYLPATIGVDRSATALAAEGIKADFKAGLLKGVR